MATNSQPPGGSPPVASATFSMAEMTEILSAAGEAFHREGERIETASDRANKQLGQFQNALSALHTVLQGVSAVANVANLVLGVFSNTVQSVANQVGGLVNLVNPGVLDRFQKAFSAFQAQLGGVFLPVLVGLTGVVQAVANALAGLSPQGRMFIVFLAGAAAGLTAGVTAGGIFVGILGTVAGGLIAGALAAEVFSVALDAATAGFAAVGAAVGAVLTAVATAGSASAGGLAALSLASGGLESFTKAFRPFLETLLGAFNSAGAALMPALAAALDAVLPAMNDLFSQLVMYVPLLGEVLVAFGGVLPPLIQMLAELLEAFLPFAEVLTKLTVVGLWAASGILRLVAALTQIGNAINPIVLLANAVRGNRRSPTGFAEQPITSAGYTGIEDLFKRAQEQAVLGQSGVQDNPFRKTMTDRTVIDAWASAFGQSVTWNLLNPNGKADGDGSSSGFLNRVAGGVGGSSSPVDVGVAIARGVAAGIGSALNSTTLAAAMAAANLTAAARGH